MNMHRRIFSSVVIAALMLSTAFGQKQSSKRGAGDAPGAAGATAAPPAPFVAAGIVNRLTKWVAPNVLGDTRITEDKNGNIGIGTQPTGSAVTVNGLVETVGSNAGIKFSDGTIQTTALGVPLNLSGDGGTILNVRNDGTGFAINSISDSIAISANGGTIAVAGVTRDGTALSGISINGPGVEGRSTTAPGVLGLSGTQPGVEGLSAAAPGVKGRSTDGPGVDGTSTTSIGVKGFSSDAAGVMGDSLIGTGILGTSLFGMAGEFLGNVRVTGALIKAGGSFKIDHPLDPANKYIYHSFVESPDMMNIYNGNITTDGNGMAVVELPEWFEALNRDFRYQLTVVGQFAQAIVAEKVKGNRFTIQTSSPNVEVSWQVTGIRQDAWANDNRIRVEEEKSEKERGLYLHPEAFKQSEEKSVLTVQFPERARELKQRRLNSEPTQNQPN
jgi:hypothetical protein